MIPQSFIQDLLARTDVVEVVGRHVTLKKAGINFKGLCPFHGEKSPSFIVSPSRQTYHCFGCGVHGNALGFLMENGGLGFVEAVKELAQMQGMPVPDDNSSPQDRERAKAQKEKQATLTDVMAQAMKHWKQQLKITPRAVKYLKGRGLTGEIAARFALGYAPENWRGLASAFPKYDDPILVEAGLVITQDPQPGENEGKRYDRFRDRIMFPIRNPQGEVIGFGGRVLDKGEPKYLNSPETPVFTKGRELYGLYEGRAALRNKGYAIVTEGYMDVVALAQWGFGNAVATLGTACTAEHVQKLFRFTEHVVFSFDGDAAGRRAAGRALEAALPFATDTRRIGFLFLPAEHDPDSYIREFGAEAFEACVKKAVPLSRQIIEHASADCDLDTAEGRARLLAQAIPLIRQLPDGALKGQIADDLATQARTQPEEVRKRLHEGHNQGPRSGSGHGARQTTRGDGPDEIPVFEPDDFGAGDHWQPPDFDDGSYSGHQGGGPDGGYGDTSGGYPNRSRSSKWSGEGRQGKRWRDGTRWQKHGSPVAARPLPQAATPLDRIAWLLVNHSDFWEQLPESVHDLLCEQDPPYGEFFRWLDKTIVDQGVLPADDLMRQMRDNDDDFGQKPENGGRFTQLADRISRFLDLSEAKETVTSLLYMIKPLELELIREKLELLNQSGELSEAAESQKLELIRQSLALKLEISQKRPISG
ncbi:DNA primase [Aquabacterium sp.]|uniref:DNA primase n=1 Tax=Aquabacterium sp. TaxID=1872578 RepID=UPI002E315642|nr:DNA primase [Aquabacterium sp.]HEX5310967.1 DNA primase [Aquabacterium sp.]